MKFIDRVYKMPTIWDLGAFNYEDIRPTPTIINN